MHIQGDLQKVFDALYNLGIIDPVLQQDWKVAMSDRPAFQASIATAVDTLNTCGTVEEMMDKLSLFEERVLEFLAMEVAREYADFHAREALH